MHVDFTVHAESCVGVFVVQLGNSPIQSERGHCNRVGFPAIHWGLQGVFRRPVFSCRFVLRIFVIMSDMCYEELGFVFVVFLFCGVDIGRTYVRVCVFLELYAPVFRAVFPLPGRFFM